jgi:hypothetical protein
MRIGLLRSLSFVFDARLCGHQCFWFGAFDFVLDFYVDSPSP